MACFADRGRAAAAGQKGRFIEAHGVPLFHRIGLVDVVVEAVDLDAAVGVMQFADDAGQGVDRIEHGVAVHPRMQIMLGAVQDGLHADDAAEHRGDRRRLMVPHAGVADDARIGLQCVAVFGQERIETATARFLFALQQHDDADRQGAVHGLPGGRPRRRS